MYNCICNDPNRRAERVIGVVVDFVQMVDVFNTENINYQTKVELIDNLEILITSATNLKARLLTSMEATVTERRQ